MRKDTVAEGEGRLGCLECSLAEEPSVVLATALGSLISE